MQGIKIIRYSETDLLTFKKVIDTKLIKVQKQLDSLDAQLSETSANKGNQSDWVDDSSNSSNLQLLDTMAHRLRKHHRDLKNALLRIQNKSYGICSVTGKLIDKKRLMAVPTTTKSVAVKTAKKNRPPKRMTMTRVTSPKIISRVISKTNTPKKEESMPSINDNQSDIDNLIDNIEALDLNQEMEE